MRILSVRIFASRLRLIGPAAVVAAAVLIGGCMHSGKPVRVYQRAALQNYNTFFVLPGNASGDSTYDQRLTDEIRSALLSKGWVEAPAPDARAVVVIHTATAARASHQSFYEGWGGWQWRVEGQASPSPNQDYQAGSVVVDIFDADTKQAIWQASSPGLRAAVNPHHPDETTPTIARMFKDFPLSK